MNLTALFIRRPVMTALVMMAILIFGVQGYRTLPASDLPNIDFPTMQVQAMLPGASPETMASSVAAPLERQFSTIAGLTNMTSQSSRGYSQVTVQFSLDRSIDAAAQDVQNAISAVTRKLPPNMPTPPSIRKVNPTDQPIIQLAMSSTNLPITTVDDYAETLIGPAIATIDGVAQVTIQGQSKYAVRVQIDPNKLMNRGISLDDAQSALENASDLFHPFFSRMSGDPGYLHAPALQMDKEQHIIGHQTSPTEYFYSKEIATGQHIHVSREEILQDVT